MRISSRGRYSLEALLYLALLPEGSFASIRSISENTGISDGYLEQLFIPLRNSGIIKGVRGAQGGYFPGKNLESLFVGDILRAVEGSLAPVGCLVEGGCVSESSCKTRRLWEQVYQVISECVDSIRLSDLVDAYHKMDEEGYVI